MASPAHLDEHTLEVAASRDRVWQVLREYVDGLGLPATGLAGRVARAAWAPHPGSGFGVAEEEPGQRVVLEGRHRFSRYRLVFSVDEGADGSTRLTAASYADFPGLHRKAYRALVVGTGFHVLAVRRMLRSIAARAAR